MDWNEPEYDRTETLLTLDSTMADNVKASFVAGTVFPCRMRSVHELDHSEPNLTVVAIDWKRLLAFAPNDTPDLSSGI